MTKKTIAVLAALTAASLSAMADAREDALRASLLDVFTKSAEHYRALESAASALMDKGPGGAKQMPYGYNRAKRELDMRPLDWWTNGHFPGALWYLYEATGDDYFKDRAMVWTDLLEPNKTNSDHHDIGFMMYCSYGNARRLLKTDKFDAILLQTAQTLSTRFNDSLGLIRSWGKLDDKENFFVIPDNMMNLELIEWAAKHGERGTGERFDKIARSHATKTMCHHFRTDGGTYHVLNYDPRPDFLGVVQEIRRGQGLSCETAWSRGQSWAIYGYTMMYRETGEKAFLEFAQKVADYAINNPNMPEDGVPYWDYGAPGEERDSSAAAVMASALLELCGYVDAGKGAMYRAFAVKQLTSLASPTYFSEGDEIGHWLLKHGVAHKPGYEEVDSPLNYGDYYFLEALLRLRNMK